jgi:plastocyanin
MRRALTASLVSGAALLIAGCGSSGGSSSGSGATSSARSTSGTAPSASIKPSTTPKFGSPPASAPVKSGAVAIAYRNIAINPDTVKVKVGSTITWTNYDSVEHNVTSHGGSQDFASKNFSEGAGFSIKVEKPGIIHYLCTIHPASMNGTIVVVR